MRYLIMAPTEREYVNMRAALQRSDLNHEYDVVRCGIGKALAAANTAYAIVRGGKYDRIAVIGYAAATLGRKQGDIVAPGVARYHDCRIPGDFIPELTEPYALLGGDDGVVWTGDSFVNAEIIAQIKEQFGVEHGLFDMEATAICQAAGIFGLPVVVVKMVSDVPEDGHDEHSYDEFADSHSDFTVFVDYLEKLK